MLLVSSGGLKQTRTDLTAAVFIYSVKWSKSGQPLRDPGVRSSEGAPGEPPGSGGTIYHRIVRIRTCTKGQKGVRVRKGPSGGESIGFPA